MDKKLYNTWMTIVSFVLALIGLIFILISVFDPGAGKSVLIVGMLFALSGNLLNVIRMRQYRKDQGNNGGNDSEQRT